MFHKNYRLWDAIQTLCNDEEKELKETLYQTFNYTDWSEEWIEREAKYLKDIGSNTYF